LSARRKEPDPSFLAARFSLPRSLRVFCGFRFFCFSELFLMRTLPDALGSYVSRAIARRGEIRAPEGTRLAAVLETVDGARAIIVRLGAGEELGDHQSSSLASATASQVLVVLVSS
jgi:hypothetical protein